MARLYVVSTYFYSVERPDETDYSINLITSSYETAIKAAKSAAEKFQKQENQILDENKEQDEKNRIHNETYHKYTLIRCENSFVVSGSDPDDDNDDTELIDATSTFGTQYKYIVRVDEISAKKIKIE